LLDRDEDSAGSAQGDEDDSMAVDEPAAPTGPADPNDLSAYNLDTYDEEESKGAGESLLRRSPHSAD
jgi:periodic tryptophan protein 1